MFYLGVAPVSNFSSGQTEDFIKGDPDFTSRPFREVIHGISCAISTNPRRRRESKRLPMGEEFPRAGAFRST